MPVFKGGLRLQIPPRDPYSMAGPPIKGVGAAVGGGPARWQWMPFGGQLRGRSGRVADEADAGGRAGHAGTSNSI